MPLSFKHLLSFTSTAPSFNPQKINERPGLLLHHLRHLGLRWSCTCRQWCQNYDCNFFEIYNLFFTGFFPISGCTFSFCLHHHHQVPSTSSRSAIMDLQLSNLPLLTQDLLLQLNGFKGPDIAVMLYVRFTTWQNGYGDVPSISKD